MKLYLIPFLSVFIYPISVFSQVVDIEKSNEIILGYKIEIPKNNRYSLYNIGKADDKLYYYSRNITTKEKKIWLLEDEELLDVSQRFKFAIDNSLSERFYQNGYFFYSRYTLNDPINYGYQKIYLNYNNKDFLLDSIYNADKKIHASFSSDGRYLLVNTLNTLSDYYNPRQDNRIMVYDLEDIEKGEIRKEYIPCIHCSDSYLVDDRLFFTIGRQDGYENFSNKDIYVAPWGSLRDSVKIASNTDIKAVSPDGKYILGTRFWDRQKLTDVIVNVEQKKYQMLLGRDYAKQRAFYSHHEDKFTYDFKGYLIYVAFPGSYPFDVLKWKNEEIPDWTEEEFWKQYEHPPLSE
ncbi:MAG: hypothetical protein MJA30_14465 [Cytophagales bacterium]|nr:hypothetical protein [Cytophagales bacterium]